MDHEATWRAYERVSKKFANDRLTFVYVCLDLAPAWREFLRREFSANVLEEGSVLAIGSSGTKGFLYSGVVDRSVGDLERIETFVALTTRFLEKLLDGQQAMRVLDYDIPGGSTTTTT